MTSERLKTVSTHKTITQARSETAQAAIEALGPNVAAHEVLVVQCPRSHHLGSVIDTGAGPVLRALVGPHAHGRRDLPDEAHKSARHGTEQFILLSPPRHDQPTVPAWCDCGTRTLVLDDVRRALESGERTLHVD